MTEAQIKYMVGRFLGWTLPDDFAPDCHVSFDEAGAIRNNGWPIGTNLLTAAQAEAMVRHMLEGAPDYRAIIESAVDLMDGGEEIKAKLVLEHAVDRAG